MYLDGSRFVSNHPGTSALNTLIGFNSGISITTGTHNTAVGHNALNKTTSSLQNTAVGSHALFSNTTGQDNTATGAGALYYNTTGFWNTTIPYLITIKADLSKFYFIMYKNVIAATNKLRGELVMSTF